jgi:hypothetical protein
VSRRAAAFAATVLAAGVACGAPPAHQPSASPSVDDGIALVRTHDVATVRLPIDGRETEVRLIGVDVDVPRTLGCRPGGPRILDGLLAGPSASRRTRGRGTTTVGRSRGSGRGRGS